MCAQQAVNDAVMTFVHEQLILIGDGYQVGVVKLVNKPLQVGSAM
jgi:hypothetical protein